MAATKVKHFRADDETIEKIDKWMKDSGIANNEALAAIADLIELSEAKGQISGRSTEIANFENLTHQLMTAYAASLQLAQNGEERIRAEYAKKLDSNAETIADLQFRLKEAKATAEQAVENATAAEKEAASLEKAYGEQAERLEKAEATAEKATAAAEKAQAQVDSLTDLTASQGREINRLKESAAEADDLRKQVADLTAQLEQQKAEASRAVGRADERLAVALEKAENQKTAAVLAEKASSQDALAKAQEKATASIAAAQEKVTKLQDAAETAAQRHAEEIEKLRAEIDALKTRSVNKKEQH